MQENERIRDYLDSVCPGNSAVTEKIRQTAEAENMPIIRRDAEAFIRTLMAVIKPERILELGTNVGFSAIVMAESSNADITTVEIGRADYDKALVNVKLAGYEDRICCINSDAREVLKRLAEEQRESFDFIFLDAAKGQYISWLPLIEQVIKKGGVLLADNVLLEGDTVQSRYAIDRRDRTEHARMREFIEAVMLGGKWQSSVISSADGMSISVKL